MDETRQSIQQDDPRYRWLRQLVPQGQDVISIAGFVMIIISLIWIILSTSADFPAWRAYGAILITGFILLIHVWRRQIGAVFRQASAADFWLIALMAVLSLVVAWLSQASVGSAYLILAVAGSAFYLLPVRPALTLTLLTAGLFLVLVGQQPGAGLAAAGQMALALSFGLTLVTSIGWLVRRNTAQTHESQVLAASLRDANRQLLARQEQEKQLAAAEERVRLAREIHDGLGHHLTVLNVQFQLAGKLLPQQPQQAAEIVENCREEARAALAEVRRSVAVMRQPPLDGQALPQALELLVGEFNRHSPLEAVFQLQGDAAAVAPAASITCYRAAQEGLTNAQKHAHEAQGVQVRLSYQPDGLRLTVEDDGRLQSNQPAGQGFGLAGLRERAEKLGGGLQAGPRPAGGFTLSLWLPWEGNHD